MLGGRIKCDFCNFLGEMQPSSVRGSIKIPNTWISIHPTIVVHGMRNLKIKDPEYERLNTMKDKIRLKVATIHCCPGCAEDRDVFDLARALPAAPEKQNENYMRADS